MAKHHKEELKQEQARLTRMESEFAQLQIRIAKQKRRVAALAELADDTEDAEPPVGLVAGLTDACRTVLMGAERPLWPVEVKERVLALGVNPGANILASVYTILRRLHASGEIQEVTDPDGTGSTVPAYQWNIAGMYGLEAQRRRRHTLPRSAVLGGKKFTIKD